LQKDLIARLLSIGCEVFFFGTKGLGWLDGKKHEGLHDYTGRTSISEMAALLDQMDMMVSVDSFAAHLAAILGKKTMVLLNTTGKDLFSHFPCITPLTSKIDCAPCGKACPDSVCPVGYGACKAFFDGSILPEVIINRIIKELTDYFGRKI
jgi:ADP-heptose:LPS heptosyltransferase